MQQRPTLLVKPKNDKLDLKNLNPSCLVELFNPDLPESNNMPGLLTTCMSGSLGAGRLATKSERKLHKGIKEGNLVDSIRSRKDGIYADAEQIFESTEADMVSTLSSNTNLLGDHTVEG